MGRKRLQMPANMKEFKVNDYIKLKLESRTTMIYVNGERFKQCKNILLNIKIEHIENLSNIKSIDELESNYDHALEVQHSKMMNIPPETEFWAHCSNLQVLYENN